MKPTIELVGGYKGPDGNMFAIMSKAAKALNGDISSIMIRRVLDSKSYEEAVDIVKEYCEIKEVT